jgi:hypothetical protein
MRAQSEKLFITTAALSGAVTALALSVQQNDGITLLLALVRAAVCAPAAVALLSLLRNQLRSTVRKHFGDAAAERYETEDVWPYTAFLLTLTSAIGIQLVTPVWAAIALIFAVWQWATIRRAASPDPSPASRGQALAARDDNGAWGDSAILSPLFFLSGAAALIYQVAWQRTLYNHFGVNMESITVIVSIFMFGLGIGALLGGRLSRLPTHRLPWIFVGTEIGIALFGSVSIPLIQRVGTLAELRSLPIIGLATFMLLAIPTILMGATLPVLVTYLERETGDVGRSVARLYFVNTLGSAAACFLTVDVLFAFTGLRGSTIIAAACNAAVAVLAIVYLTKREATA